MISPENQRRYKHNDLWMSTARVLDELGPLIAVMTAEELTEQIYNAQMRESADQDWPVSAVIRRVVSEYFDHDSAAADTLIYEILVAIGNYVSLRIAAPRPKL